MRALWRDKSLSMGWDVPGFCGSAFGLRFRGFRVAVLGGLWGKGAEARSRSNPKPPEINPKPQAEPWTPNDCAFSRKYVTVERPLG